MVERSISNTGLLAFWSLPEWTRRVPLADGLTVLGHNKHVPQKRTPGSAFKDALESCYGKGYEIHRLKNLDAYEVVSVERREYPEPNVRTVHTVGRIDENARITFSPHTPAEWGQILAEYNKHLGLVRAQHVTQALTGIVSGWNGVALRPSGGIYWIPGDRGDAWRRVAGVVEAAGEGKSAVYLIGHDMGPDEVRAVRDAVVNDISAEAERLQKEIDASELGEKALERRQAQAVVLRRRIKEYEQLLGVGLSALAQQVEAVENAAAQAALMASAGEAVA